jgi:hypothetical protein
MACGSDAVRRSGRLPKGAQLHEPEHTQSYVALHLIMDNYGTHKLGDAHTEVQSSVASFTTWISSVPSG